MPDAPKVFGAKPHSKSVGGSASLRDTSRSYRALCASLLAAEPLCRYCRSEGRVTAARVIDHIIALSLGGDNLPANLCPSCKDCNDAKAKDERRYTRAGYDLASLNFDPAMRDWLKRAAFT